MTPFDLSARWLTQPQDGLRIALDNPIAEGLQLLVIGSAPINVVNGQFLYGVSSSAPYVDIPASAPSPSDMGLESPDLGCASPFFGRDTGALLADSSRFTLLSWHRLRSDTSYSTGLLNGWVTAGGAGYGIGIRYSSASFYPMIAASSTLEHGVSLRDDRWHLLGASHTAGAGKAWKDGVLVKTGAVPTPSQSFVNNYEHFRTGRTPLLMLFTRELRADEHESLYENQWQLIEPPRIWVPLFSGAQAPGREASGVLAAGAASTTGTSGRTRVFTSSGAAAAGAAKVAGATARRAHHSSAGACAAAAASMSGAAARTRVHTAAGVLGARAAAVAGAGVRVDAPPGRNAAGAIAARPAVIAGAAARRRLHTADGELIATGAALAGRGTGHEESTPEQPRTGWPGWRLSAWQYLRSRGRSKPP